MGLKDHNIDPSTHTGMFTKLLRKVFYTCIIADAKYIHMVRSRQFVSTCS